MKVVITGITGQDGSFMADYLLKNTNATIYGVVRQLSVPNHFNIQHLVSEKRVNLIEGDITCPHSMSSIVKENQPDYFINFAANSFVHTSWDNPTQVVETNEISVLHQLEAIRKDCPTCRYYQAGSSEEFGDVIYSPQDEKHPLRPRSMYGKSKAGARLTVKVYRESYKLYAVAGWLFNHEGIRRGKKFVTRKITSGVARIARGTGNIVPIQLGNLNAKRDWSDAEDFVDGVWRMLNQDRVNLFFSKPKDYVLASGETHTIREFVELAFQEASIDGYWVGKGIDECFVSRVGANKLVTISPDFYRPAEVDILLGDSSKAREELGWKPKSSFRDLVKKMVQHDLSEVSITN